MRVLLTGYEPFGHWTVNPAEEVVKALAASPPADCALSTRVLPVVFGEAGPLLRAAIDEVEPDVILSLGSGVMATLRVERVGLNLNDIPGRQDNRGQSPEEEAIDPDGPAAYFATIPVRRLTKHLCDKGVPAVESNSAGTFLCNHALYVARHHCAKTGRDARVGFIHLPLLPGQAAAEPGREKPASMALETQVQGIRLAIEYLIGDHNHRQESADRRLVDSRR
jgi:pyroglutamyl-peptidase